MLTLRRVAFALSMIAALAVGATPFARADMMTPCPMMDHPSGTDDAGYPMPFAAPIGAASTVHHNLDRAERIAPIYSFAVTGLDPPPPFHPPRV
jgi:hypothetical protein